MSKFDRVRGSFERAHDDLFPSTTYDAEFINTTQGTRSNVDDSYSGESETSLGTIQVEIVPPAMDTTVRETGTSFSWDTSIRFPLSSFTSDEDSGGTYSGTTGGTYSGTTGLTYSSKIIDDELIPLGDDNQKPTRVEIVDPEDSKVDAYELHGYSYEKGSGMLMCRLVEK